MVLVRVDSAKAHFDGEPIKVGLLASGKGSNVENILRQKMNSKLNIEVQTVIYNQHGALVKNVAQQYSVPSDFVKYDMKNRSNSDLLLHQILEDRGGVDLVILAGWMVILTNTFTDLYKDRIINIHPSLLPLFKGDNAVEQALKSGVKITGATTHIVTEDVDSGEILEQAAVKICKGDDEKALHRRIQEAEYHILPETIRMFAKYEG